MKRTDELIGLLNSENKDVRINALKEIKKLIDSGDIKRENTAGFANNHIHTKYSFSSYSPSAAVFYGWRAGLEVCGIIDHDTLSGCSEFKEAGKILGMPTTCGLECRVKTDGTELFGRRINNIDQPSLAFVVMHAVPESRIEKINNIFSKYRENRNARNEKMCSKLNSYLNGTGIEISFKDDVLPLSNYSIGGTVTERHICMALVNKITEKFKCPECVISFLKNSLNVDLTEKEETILREKKDDLYEYDISNILKKNIVEKFYIDADDECMHITEFVKIAKENGCICAYAYLGDVTEQNMGEKKIQTFEDSYIDLLFSELKRMNFDAVTYMPSRNTEQQLIRVIDYCHKNGFLEINGEDVNSPRTPFQIKALQNPTFSHLKELSYVLVGHETAVNNDITKAIYSDEMNERFNTLDEKISYYKGLAEGER